jgi:hypothetical protein
LQKPLEVFHVDTAPTVQLDLDHGGEIFAPGDFVGVVFIGADENHRLVPAQVFGKVLVRLVPECVFQHAGQVLPGRGRQRHADNLLQLVDGAGRPAAHANDPAIGTRIDGILNGLLGLLQEMRHRAAADVVFGMGIGVDPLLVLDVFLHETQTTAGGGVVRIYHQARAEWRIHGRIGSDDFCSERREIQGARLVHVNSIPTDPAKTLFYPYAAGL